MHNDLHMYLRKGLERGYSDEMMIRSLRRTGYHEAAVRAALADIKLEMVAPVKHPTTLFLEMLFAIIFLLTLTLVMIFAFIPVLTQT